MTVNEEIYAVKEYQDRWLAVSSKARFLTMVIMMDHFEVTKPRAVLDLAENLHNHIDTYENFDEWQREQGSA